MNVEKRPTLEQLIAQTSTICSPPLIYNRLNDAIGHPRTSVKDIAQIISEDPGLTARILKMANSPLYGNMKVDSISRAVTLIGTREIRDLSLAALVIHSFPGIPEDLLNVSKYWKHSVACGVVARNLAIYLRETSIERFFVAGILHDMGQIILCILNPQIVKKLFTLCNTEQLPIFTVEQNYLGFDHAKVAGELLDSWKIPLNIVELVAHHHTPSNSVTHSRDATIIHIADIISQALEYGANAEMHITPLDLDAWNSLQLPLSAVETVIKQSELQLKDIFAILLEGK